MKSVRVLALLLVVFLTLPILSSCGKTDPADVSSAPTITATDSPEALETARRFTEAVLALDTATVTQLTPEFMMRYYLTQYEYEIGESVSDSYRAMLEEQLALTEEEAADESEFVSCAPDTEYDLDVFYADLSFYGLTEQEIASLEAFSPITVIVRTAGQEVKNSLVCARIADTWYVLI